MADLIPIQITGLPPIDSVTSATEFPADKGGGMKGATAAQILAFLLSADWSTLPTSDPGGGKLWLNGSGVAGQGVLQVGP